MFEKIYGSESHTQIVEKSGDFLRYLLKEDCLDKSKLDQLLKSSQSSVLQHKLALYKIINEVSFEIKQEDTNHILRTLF